MESLNSAHEEHGYACLLPKQGEEGGLKLNKMLTSFPQPPRHMPQLELVNASAPLHDAAPHKCKGLAVRHRSNLDLKQHLSRAEEAISDIYTCSASEGVLVFDPTGLPQPAAQPMLSAHMDPSCFSTAHLWGNVAGAVRQGEHTLKEMEPAWT